MEGLSKNIKHQIAEKMMDVESGNEYAIEVFAFLKGIKSFCDDAMKELEEDAFIDAEKNKGSVFHGYEVSTKDGSKRFTFNHIPEWNTLKLKMKDLEESSKQAWNMSQKNANFVTDDGEIVTPAEMKFGKQSIVLTKTKK